MIYNKKSGKLFYQSASKMKIVYNFWALYFSYFSSCFMLCCVANRVETMNELLSCSGWHVMDTPDYYLEIIDRRRPDQPERRLTVNHLVARPVTRGNVTDKIQIAHQFLSCSYARVLMELCDYEKGIGPQCRSKITASESFDCLQDYLQIIRHKHSMVSRMIGALSSLQHLASSQTQLEEAVCEILGDLEKFYKQKTVVRPPDDDDQAIRKTAEAECKAIEQHARLIFKRLFAFYNRFCWPNSHYLMRHRYSEAEGAVKRFVEDNENVVKIIKLELEKLTKEFTDLHDNTSGFEYDPESHTSRIITYDPNTIERVNKLNCLLGNRIYWNMLKPLEIKERDSPYRTNMDDLHKPAGGPYNTVIVTKDNVYSKLKKSHNFLSCKYAAILKECCDHVTSMWTNCQESKDLVCLEKFLEILNDADPSVSRMIKSLSYFYKLSSNTVYNKRVFYLLASFKNFHKDRTTQDNPNAMTWSPAIENSILKITQDSYEFCQQFCYSEYKYEFDAYMVSPDYLKNGTIDIKGGFFLRRLLFYVLRFTF